jgi:hypothetical protein
MIFFLFSDQILQSAYGSKEDKPELKSSKTLRMSRIKNMSVSTPKIRDLNRSESDSKCLPQKHSSEDMDVVTPRRRIRRSKSRTKSGCEDGMESPRKPRNKPKEDKPGSLPSVRAAAYESKSITHSPRKQRDLRATGSITHLPSNLGPSAPPRKSPSHRDRSVTSLEESGEDLDSGDTKSANHSPATEHKAKVYDVSLGLRQVRTHILVKNCAIA